MMRYLVVMVLAWVVIVIIVGILVKINKKEINVVTCGVLFGILVYWIIYDEMNQIDYNVIDDKAVVGSLDIKKLIEDGVEYIDYKVENGKVVIDSDIIDRYDKDKLSEYK